MKQTISSLVIEEELLKSLLFTHKIDFFQFTDAVLFLKEKYRDSSKDTQLAITM